MKIRVKYIKIGADWRYALQFKKWIFWKTIETFLYLDNVKEFLDKLKKVEEFNKRFDSNSLTGGNHRFEQLAKNLHITECTTDLFPSLKDINEVINGK
jgi:hypothetical protein